LFLFKMAGFYNVKYGEILPLNNNLPEDCINEFGS